MTMLSAHFSLDELTVSETAARRGWDNTPLPEALANLRRLADTLERIRSLIGPLIITSGYRSQAVNNAVGGSVGSQHLVGCAADFICPTHGSPLLVAETIYASGIFDLDQLIHEYGRWVHISVLPVASHGKPRGAVLTIDRRGVRFGLLEVRP